MFIFRIMCFSKIYCITGTLLYSPFNISKQILPNLSIFGWYILVINRTFGADIGYSSGKNSSSLNVPPSYGDCNFFINSIPQIHKEKIYIKLAFYNWMQLQNVASSSIYYGGGSTHILWAYHHNMEISCIWFIWGSFNSSDWFVLQALSFLNKINKYKVWTTKGDNSEYPVHVAFNRIWNFHSDSVVNFSTKSSPPSPRESLAETSPNTNMNPGASASSHFGQ